MRFGGRTLVAGALVCILAMLGGIGCDGGTTAVGPKSSFTFPLRVGNSWQYSRMFYSYGCEPDNLMHLVPDTVFATEITTIESINKLPNLPETYVLHTVWVEGSATGEGYSWRNNTQEGLYTYAYQFTMGTVGPPKLVIPEGSHLSFKGRRFSNVNELLGWARSIMEIPASAGKLTEIDSIQYEDPPARDIAYPIEVGQRWVYRDSANPWAMEKEVVDIERVSTPALTADCLKIRWYWDIDDDGQWDSDIDGYDYLAVNGILKRRFDFFGVVIRNENSDSLGTFNTTDIYELIDYELKL